MKVQDHNIASSRVWNTSTIRGVNFEERYERENKREKKSKKTKEISHYWSF